MGFLSVKICNALQNALLIQGVEDPFYDKEILLRRMEILDKIAEFSFTSDEERSTLANKISCAAAQEAKTNRCYNERKIMLDRRIEEARNRLEKSKERESVWLKNTTRSCLNESKPKRKIWRRNKSKCTGEQ